MEVGWIGASNQTDSASMLLGYFAFGFRFVISALKRFSNPVGNSR